MKKIPHTILLSLLFFAATALQAQDDYFCPFNNRISKNILGENINGPVKSITAFMQYTDVNYTDFQPDKLYVEYYDESGRCYALTHYHQEQPVATYTYTYDSLGQYISSNYGEWGSRLFYDTLGRVSHIIVFSENDTNLSTRFSYDEKGNCNSKEIFSTDIEMRYVFEYEGFDYQIKRNIYQYDSLNRCIWTATIVDGDTLYIYSRQFGANGKTVELTEWNDTRKQPLTTLYFYDDEDRLVKAKVSPSEETIYEYDEENHLVNKRNYNSELDTRYQWRWKYDSYNNPVENTYESGSADNVYFSYIFKYKYEYYN